VAEGVAYELKLGPVLRWSVSSRSAVQEGLYSYDAIRRLRISTSVCRAPDDQAASGDIGQYLRLGPLGTG
jgi:hypothetical protein